MSTPKNNITAQRIASLARSGENLFHAKDLANLWNLRHPNTLRVTLKRYVAQGLLHRVYRGFYSLVPPEQLSPETVGAKSLHGFCILSTETVLYEAGYRSQPPPETTFVSEISKHWKVGLYVFRSRQLAPQHLYNSAGVTLENGVQKASPERAIVDLLYFNPWAAFDRKVDWQKIKTLQKQIQYPLTPHRYDPPKT